LNKNYFIFKKKHIFRLQINNQNYQTMKKLLLFSFISLGYGIHAQVQKTNWKTKSRVGRVKESSLDKKSFMNQINSGLKSNAIINDISIGTANNSYGASGNRLTPLSSSPELNTINLIHRAKVGSPVEVTNSGFYTHDYSSNSGATWSSDLGPNFTPVNGIVARYPSSAISNPTGNTVATNAYAYYIGPALNPGFTAIAFGSYQIGQTGPNAGNSNAVNQDPATGLELGFPDGMYANANFALSPMVTSPDMAAVAAPFKIKLFKLTGAGTPTTALSVINLPPITPTTDGMCRIAFAPNGLTGFITYQGDDSLTAALPGNDRLKIYITKTTDGGVTWSTWNKLDLTVANFPALDSLEKFDVVAPMDSTEYTTDFNHDLSVDANGNPYILTGISSVKTSTANYEVSEGPSIRGAYVLYSTNGGTSFTAKMLSRLESFRNTLTGNNPDALSHDNNYTASRNGLGTVISFGFLDTRDFVDTTFNNNFADLYLSSIVLSGPGSPYFTNEVNITDGTLLTGAMDFGQGANYLINNGSTLEFPFMYTEAGLDANGEKDMLIASTYHYVQGIEVSLLPSGVSKLKSNLEMVKLFPNPSKGLVNIKVVPTAKNVSLEIVNIVGQTVYATKLEAGSNKIDLTSLNAGVYFANILIDGLKSTQKIVID
jgi:hypothetical protein